MRINRGFLVNERSARHLGIQRGSVGSFDPCIMDRVSTRPITDSERNAAKITGTERRVFAPGSWAETQADIKARKAMPAKAIPVKAPRKGKARKATATPVPTASDKRREKMSLDDYYREQKACGVRS